MSHLPRGWKTAPLGSLTEPVSKRPPTGGDGESFTYIDLSSIDQRLKQVVTPTEVPVAEAPSRARQVVATGDVLVSTVRPNLNGVAVVPPDLDGATASTGFCVLRPDRQVLHGPYLFHWVRSQRFIASMVRLSTGASYPAVTDRIVKSSELPLPPLEEQRRIAAILDKADELRAKRRRARSHLADLQGSLFKAMFGRAVDNGSGRVLGDLIEIQIGPFGSLLHQSDYVVGGVPLVNPMHLVDGRIVPRSRETVAPEAVERLGRYVLREGDVVLGRRGDMGRCAVVGPAEAGFICGSGSMILRPHSDNVRPRFLAAALSSLEARDELARRAKGVTMLNLNSDAVASVRLVCPPLDEQIRFERAIHEVDLRAKAQVRSEEDLDSLFASLQSRAFRGEL